MPCALEWPNSKPCPPVTSNRGRQSRSSSRSTLFRRSWKALFSHMFGLISCFTLIWQSSSHVQAISSSCHGLERNLLYFFFKVNPNSSENNTTHATKNGCHTHHKIYTQARCKTRAQAQKSHLRFFFLIFSICFYQFPLPNELDNVLSISV